MVAGVKKFVWDTSAIINIKEPNALGYSPGHSLFKDLCDGWIPGPYLNIFPSLAVFEVSATVSRKKQNGSRILREFYLMDENSILYDVNRELVSNCCHLFSRPGFDQLKGADLVFACIAHIEMAFLVTLDKKFSTHLSTQLQIIDLNRSKHDAIYRKLFAG